MGSETISRQIVSELSSLLSGVGKNIQWADVSSMTEICHFSLIEAEFV